MKGTQIDAFAHLLPGASEPAISASEVIAQLRGWSDAGWLRRLDSAFAAFVAGLVPDGCSPMVVFAAAMVAHMEGQGHSCLPLEALVPVEASGARDDLLETLAWPPAASDVLQALLALLPPHAGAWLDALHASPVVHAADAAHEDRHQPLVLSAGRLYLRRHWRCERSVVCEVKARVGRRHAVDVASARAWLDRLFPPRSAPPEGGEPATDWQKVACAVALRAGLTLVTGGPGTGKTYTAARLLTALCATHPAPETLRVALAAPTGKAAARLKQSIDGALGELQARLGDALPLREWAGRIGPARTLHALLGARPQTRKFRHDEAHPLPVDLLIVDEASMVHLELMASLLDALRPDARLILLGDKDQLASVEAGAVLGDLCRNAQAGRYGEATRSEVLALAGEVLPTDMVVPGEGPLLAQQTVMLRESRRFAGAIGQLALAVNQGDAERALALLRHGQRPQAASDPEVGAVRWLEGEAATPASVVRLAVDGRGADTAGYRYCLDAMRRRPRGADLAVHHAWVVEVLTAFDRCRVLCAVREGEWGVGGLNPAIERELVSQGRLARRSGAGGDWYEGRPVMVTRNDAALGVFNGDIGMALPSHAEGAGLRVYFLEGRDGVRSVSASRLADVEPAWAMTVHKSQGSEFEHTVLVLPPAPGPTARAWLTRELLYTGITRARRALTVVAESPRAVSDAVLRGTRRVSGLRLD